jgi:ribosomal protein S12 methylthiotransferase RimO
MPGIFMASLGCAKNLVEAERMLGETLDSQHHLVLDPNDADIIIVNTCGFIEDARNEAREVIREYLEVKKSSRKKPKLAIAGCWAERSPDDVVREFPGVDAVWGLQTPHALAQAIRQLKTPGHDVISGIGKPPRQEGDGARLATTLPSFAYLKISDGCDNRCHYCAIPLIRGSLQSRSPDSVLDEAKKLADQGASELIVIGQDTTAYGNDLGMKNGLASLLERLLRAVSVPRIRVLYAHPAHLDDTVIVMLRSEPRLCRYLDLPLQHVASPVLAAMGRGYGRERIDELLEKLGESITLRTTFLTGFPGETESQFEEIIQVIKTGAFNHLGAFAYSPEPGTPAFELPNQVPPEEAARRRDAIMEAQRTVAFAWLDKRIGGMESILVDSRLDRDWASGRSVHEAPDADGRVLMMDAGTQPGERVDACIKARDGYDLVAERPAKGKPRPGKRNAGKR